MTTTLTADDIAKLTSYANSGDRFDYWTLLSSKGDRYGNLALGVVTGADIAGAIANGYAASYAAAGSPLADSQSTIAWWTVGNGIMRADLQARINAGDATTITFSAIQQYHASVFTANGLPVEAWTPYLPFKKYIVNAALGTVLDDPVLQANATSSAENGWRQMLSNILGQVWSANFGLAVSAWGGFDSWSDIPVWYAKVLAAGGSFTNAVADNGGNVQKISLRNADYIEGWSYESSTGRWYSDLQGTPGVVPQINLVFADSATTAKLNAERQSRIVNYGSNVEYIDSVDPNGVGSQPIASISVGSTKLTGGTQSGANDWSSNGVDYSFAGMSSASPIGTLTITDAALGAQDTLQLSNFDLSQAMFGANGFDGIHLTSGIKITSTGAFSGEVDHAFEIAVDAVSPVAQTVQVTLSGASSSDFEVLANGQLQKIGAGGQFNLILDGGTSEVGFVLVDVSSKDGTSDISSGASLQLTASLQDSANPSAPSISSSPFVIAYSPVLDKVAAPPKSMTIIAGNNGSYTGDGGNDQVIAAFVDNNINLFNSVDDSIIGGTGANTIFGGSGTDVITLQGTTDQVGLGAGHNTVNGGSGHDTMVSGQGNAVINGHNGTDVILLGSGSNQVYADSQVSIAQAISQLASATPTGQQGDLVSVLDGNDTIVGGKGNDLINVGSGHTVVVMGPGQDTFLGGWDLTEETGSWSATYANNVVTVTNVEAAPEAFSNS